MTVELDRMNWRNGTGECNAAGATRSLSLKGRAKRVDCLSKA